MRFFLVCVLVVASAAVAQAQPVDRLVPVFAVEVPGANGSLWRSELHFYNATDQAQSVTFSRLFPFGTATCTPPVSMNLLPREMRQVRTLSCGAPAAVAMEIRADRNVNIRATVTNVAAAAIQDESCCYSGFTEQIPVELLEEAYATRQTLASIPVAVDPRPSERERHLTRVNVGIVNPNPVTITVENTLFDPTGVQKTGTGAVLVPAFSALQINDWLPYDPHGPIPLPNFYRGYYRIETSSTFPYYLYGSVVDNATNDATVIAPQQ